jgi:hypothetical protein
MKCVLCAEPSFGGFYMNSSERQICFTCFDKIKGVESYAPNPFQEHPVSK